MLGSVCDLEVEVGFEGTIQDPEIDSNSSSMSGGRGMFGTFLFRNLLTTVIGNMSRIESINGCGENLSRENDGKKKGKEQKKETHQLLIQKQTKKNVLHWHGGRGPIGPLC